MQTHWRNIYPPWLLSIINTSQMHHVGLPAVGAIGVTLLFQTFLCLLLLLRQIWLLKWVKTLLSTTIGQPDRALPAIEKMALSANLQSGILGIGNFQQNWRDFVVTMLSAFWLDIQMWDWFKIDTLYWGTKLIKIYPKTEIITFWTLVNSLTSSAVTDVVERMLLWSLCSTSLKSI